MFLFIFLVIALIAGGAMYLFLLDDDIIIKGTVAEVEGESTDLRSQMDKAIDIIKLRVPDDYITRDSLFGLLDWIATDYSYRAPELQYVSWEHLEKTINEYFSEEIDEEEPWMQELANELLTLPKGN